MHAFLRLLTCGLLAWQAADTVVWDVRGFARNDAGWGFLLTADTDARIRHALGRDAELLIELRAAVPPGQVVLNRQAAKSFDDVRENAKDAAELQHAIERIGARTLLFVQMSHLLHPDVLFVTLPDPVPVIEEGVHDAPNAQLIVIDEDPAPDDRPGWTRVHRGERFQLWRFQKAS